MKEIYQNILNVIIIIFLLVAAILFYKQQKAISQLSSMLNSKNSAALSEVNKEMKKKASVDPIDQVKESFTTKANSIRGRLVSISGNNLTVEAEMPDWDKMKETSASKGSPFEEMVSVPTCKKNYAVTVNNETKFTANKLDDMKPGDTILVTSKELVCETDELTAVEIISPFEKSNLP